MPGDEPPPPHQDPDRSAAEFAERYWDELLELEPFVGTEVGDERFDDRLPDPTEAGRARRESVQRAALAAVQGFDRSRLGLVERTTLDVIESIARRDLDDVTLRLDLLRACSHLYGPASQLAEVASLQRVDTPERVERYLARLEAFPAYLAALADVAREGAAAGVTSPRLVVDRAIAQVERLISLAPADSPVLAALAAAPDAARERVASLVAERLWPAYAGFLQTLREYRPAATRTLGLSALPGGEARYRAQIRAWTSLDLEPETVHRTGVEDLERIEEERREIARRLGFDDAEAALADHQASGRDTASSREAIVRLAEDQVRRGWEAAPGFFGRLPEAACEVRAVEEYREADMPFAFYFGPTEDGSRPGIYYVNTSTPGERPLHQLATTTFHEAVPGHHFQVSIEQEYGDRPSVRRFGGILGSSAFIEGWGLYSERLADEMGLFADDYERLGMLGAQGMRAARLVVDTGLHALGWDRDRSIAQMEAAGVNRLDAEIEVDRYVALPGQALSYKIGQLEIERWRREAAERAGSSFSLADFHDRLLSIGSLPLPVIERELSAPA